MAGHHKVTGNLLENLRVVNSLVVWFQAEPSGKGVMPWALADVSWSNLGTIIYVQLRN